MPPIDYEGWILTHRPDVSTASMSNAQRNHYDALDYFDQRMIRLDFEIEHQKLIRPLQERNWWEVDIPNMPSKEAALEKLFDIMAAEISHNLNGATVSIDGPVGGAWSPCGKNCHIGTGAAMVGIAPAPVTVKTTRHAFDGIPWEAPIVATFKVDD